MQDRILKEFARKACSGEMIEKTLGVADGTIRDEQKRDAVFGHIAHCPSCLHAFEQYEPFEETSSDFPGKKHRGLIEIIFSLVQGAIQPLTGPFLVEPAGVPVLGYNASRISVYRVPVNEGELTLRAIPTGGTFSLEVPMENRDTRFYLMGGGIHEIASPHDGIVTFRNIPPGEYVLSRDYRDFIAIRVDS